MKKPAVPGAYDRNNSAITSKPADQVKFKGD
jgi:hypothetical protein